MTQGEKNLEDIQKMVTVELISSVSSISVLFAHFRTKYILQEYFKAHNQKMPSWKLEIVNFGNTKGCPILIENGEEFIFITLLSLTHLRKIIEIVCEKLDNFSSISTLIGSLPKA